MGKSTDCSLYEAQLVGLSSEAVGGATGITSSSALDVSVRIVTIRIVFVCSYSNIPFEVVQIFEYYSNSCQYCKPLPG